MNGNENGGTALRTLLGLVGAVSLFTLGWMFQHEGRVSTIESNRFTAKEAADFREDIYDRLVAMEYRLLKQLPPQWLRDDVTLIKEGQKDISKRLTILETKIDR